MRTPAFRQFARSFSLALFAERHGLSTSDALERVAALDSKPVGRRAFVTGLGAAGALGALAGPMRAFAQANPSVAIVGAGLAGLACADRLAAKGVSAAVYEVGTRPGGRCFSLRGTFPGQVVENGGELIDNLHKTMIGYARRYRLALEDYEKQPGEAFYYFDGQPWPESAVVDEYRAFVAAMQADLRTLSSAPTADVHTAADIALDRMSLAEYLLSRGAGRLVSKAIEAAYVAEYGLEAAQQSALGFLLFIHADKRSRFTPFGIFSDERYHVVDGNDRIAEGLAGDLPQPIRYGHQLRRVARTSAGRIELTFLAGGKTMTAAFDRVVLTLPFTALRDVELAPGLQLPAWKRQAIDLLGYGANAKMMIGFEGPHWRGLGSKGASYSDLTNHQATWETNWTRATGGRAVLTDYSGGARGVRLDPRRLQTEVAAFLADLDRVFPGASAQATRNGGSYLAHLESWPKNPYTKGSYTCYLPGQFTTIAGNEGKRVGNLLFAGEHTNSFYEWQGFMEGACLSGLDAAASILADLKRA